MGMYLSRRTLAVAAVRRAVMVVEQFLLVVLRCVPRSLVWCTTVMVVLRTVHVWCASHFRMCVWVAKV